MSNQVRWWGYLHQPSGTIQVKRWHPLYTADDLKRAENDPSVEAIVYPFEETSKEKAIDRITNELLKKGT